MSFDPTQFKNQQRTTWDAMASGWRNQWQTFERNAQPVSDRLVEMVELREGDRILDIATGIGEPAMTAARRVGPTGRVVAIDQSSRMIAIAAERAAESGLQNVELLEMDGENVDLPPNQFDAILCRWGLMFFPDPLGSLTRLCQLLIPGGRLAAAVWSAPDKVPTISLPMRITREMLQIPPPAAVGPGIFSLADANALESMLRTAGFNQVTSERVKVVREFESTNEFVAHIRDVAGPLNAMLAEHPAERREEVWQAIEEALRQFTIPDGSLRSEDETICIVGQR